LSFNVWYTKPNIWIFQHLQNISWIDISKIMMVGDSFVSDVKWSHDAWMYPVHLDRTSKWIQDNWRYKKISSLQDLKEIL
jgi:FMN phosphatase YigB (HAD superfamily)